MRPRVLLLPGLYDSGPEHWHTHWERVEPSFLRVVQRNWESPSRGEWVGTLDAAVTAAGPQVVLAAHSTSCALVAFWAAETGRTVHGALLVGPSDTEAPGYPPGPSGWQPMPLGRIPFPTIVVASENDEYGTYSSVRTPGRLSPCRVIATQRPPVARRHIPALPPEDLRHAAPTPAGRRFRSPARLCTSLLHDLGNS